MVQLIQNHFCSLESAANKVGYNLSAITLTESLRRSNVKQTFFTCFIARSHATYTMQLRNEQKSSQTHAGVVSSSVIAPNKACLPLLPYSITLSTRPILEHLDLRFLILVSA